MADSTKYTSKLSKASILIFGGSSGIGYGVAEAVLENGATVYISSSSQSRVDDAVKRLQKSYPSKKDSISGVVCDLGSEEMESNIVEALEAVTKKGKLDHVVHTAGDKLATLPLAELSLEKIRKAGNVRFYSPLLLAKHISKHLNPGPKSSLTLTTGSVAEKPIPNWATVASYAGGLRSMTRGLALDLKPIRVNLVSPGAVNTELWNHMEEAEREKLFENMKKGSLTGEVGTVEDLAEQYLALIRDNNVTGSIVYSDGGHVLV